MNKTRVRLLKMLMGSVGQWSKGLRIATATGLTSGKTLDYVYRNRPSGRGPVGRALDRLYLSNPAWQAVRSRKAALEGLLDWSIRLQVERRGRAFILDVASGPARYLQDVLLKFPDAAIEAVCWDLDEKWLDEGHESAGARGLRNMLYQRADALAAGSYARLPAWPNIAIASGFYDWIDDDELLRRSLRLVHDALSAGGHFLFTIQTGQVQLELTNALFRSFNGRPLRMTNRPAEVVHDWARQAGFELARTHRDRTGSYAVTVAEKVA